MLTHAYEPVDVPDAVQVNAYLPPYDRYRSLILNVRFPSAPWVGPEAFEVKYFLHQQHLRALEVMPELVEAFEQHFQRRSGGLCSAYRMEDADIAVIAMGSVIGTIKDAVDELRNTGVRVGCVKIGCYRPFPKFQVSALLEKTTRVIVGERPCRRHGRIVSADVQSALQKGRQISVHTVIAGLGGRSISTSSLKHMILEAHCRTSDRTVLLGPQQDAVIEQELARRRDIRRAGPVAEHMLQTMNVIGTKVS